MDRILIVLAQSLEQPRIVKRIIKKAEIYDAVHVYGFTRGIHKVKNYGVLTEKENVSVNIIGKLENAKYINRLVLYLKLIILLLKKYGFKKKYIYVFGLDLRMLCVFVFNSKICYEISDIFWLYKSHAQRILLSAIDKFLVKFSHKVIFTSAGFYFNHYKKSINKNRIEIAENKLETYDKVFPVEKIKDDKVRIAYIGAFRYTKIIENLIKAVISNENLILNFYGGGPDELIEVIKMHSIKHFNIFYHGAFKNPDDLEKIYKENNLNFVVYNNVLENERVAMPNKFYESGFFNIPIVCANNTYVGERVIENNMGWAIDIDYNSISNFLGNLSLRELKKCHKEIKKIDKNLFKN